MSVLELVHGIIQAALILFLAVTALLCWVLCVTRNHRYDGQADRLDRLDGERSSDDEDYTHWAIR